MELQEVHGFRSPDHFLAVERLLDEACAAGAVSEITPGAMYSGSWEFRQRWFIDQSSTVWRLVAPEYPFRGALEPIDTDGRPIEVQVDPEP